jgi:hypothetical protein
MSSNWIETQSNADAVDLDARSEVSSVTSHRSRPTSTTDSLISHDPDTVHSGPVRLHSETLETAILIANTARHVAKAICLWEKAAIAIVNDEVRKSLSKVKTNAILPSAILQTVIGTELRALDSSWSETVGGPGLIVNEEEFRVANETLCRPHSNGCLCAPTRRDRFHVFHRKMLKRKSIEAHMEELQAISEEHGAMLRNLGELVDACPLDYLLADWKEYFKKQSKAWIDLRAAAGKVANADQMRSNDQRAADCLAIADKCPFPLNGRYDPDDAWWTAPNMRWEKDSNPYA